MYISNNVAERIKATAKIKGISVKKLLEDVDLGFNTMSNMKTSMPKADNLAKIADYLDCSVDFLLGRIDVLEAKINSSPAAIDERALDELLILRLDQLTEAELAQVDAFVQGLLANR